MSTLDTEQYDSQTILELFTNHKSWEQKYRQILQLSKSLKPMEEQYKTELNRIKGCESDVWLHIEKSANNEAFEFTAQSNARIVRGLLVIILAVYQNRTAEQIGKFNIEEYFTKLDLIKHLSPSRANGIHAIVEKIKSLSQ